MGTAPYDITSKEALEYAEPVQFATFTPSGDLLTCHADRVRLRDVKTGRKLAVEILSRKVERAAYSRFSDSTRSESISISNDSKKISTVSIGGAARIHDIETGDFLLLLSEPRQFLSMEFFPDSRSVLGISTRGEASIWDCSTGALLLTFGSPDREGLWNSSISPDGRLLVICKDKNRSISLWDVKDIRVAEAKEQPVIPSIAESDTSTDVETCLEANHFEILQENERMAVESISAWQSCASLFDVMRETIDADARALGTEPALQTENQGVSAPQTESQGEMEARRESARELPTAGPGGPLQVLQALQEDVRALESQLLDAFDKGKYDEAKNLVKERDLKRAEFDSRLQSFSKHAHLWERLRLDSHGAETPPKVAAGMALSMREVSKVRESVANKQKDLLKSGKKVKQLTEALITALQEHTGIINEALAIQHKEKIKPITFDALREAVASVAGCPSRAEQAEFLDFVRSEETRSKIRKQGLSDLEKMQTRLRRAEAELIEASGKLFDYESALKKARISRKPVADWDSKVQAQAEVVAHKQKNIEDLKRELLEHPALRDFPEFTLDLSDSPPIPSDVIDEYKPEDFVELAVLSRTSFLEVRRVRHRETGAEVVLKHVFDTTNFEREVRHLQKLRHPLILPLEKAFPTRDRLILQLPFLPLGSLRGWFESQKVTQTRSMEAIRGVMQQVFQAVSFIHSQGVVHRDLKPENILWIREGRPVLSDFGLGRSVEGAPNATICFPTANPSVFPGAGAAVTPAYAAPELMAQGDGWKSHPWAVDLWSLGVMMQELVLGTIPSDPANAQRPAEFTEPGMDSLWDLACGLLEKEPSERTAINEALLHPFFQHSRIGESTTSILSLEARVADLRSLLQRKGETRSKNPVRVAADFAAAHMNAADFGARWIVVGPDARTLELSEAIKTYTDKAIKDGILEQGTPENLLVRPYLPSAQFGDSDTAKLVTFGQILAKAVLEGVPIDIDFSLVLFEFLRGDQALKVWFSNYTDVMRAMTVFEPSKGRQMEEIMRRDFKEGSTLETVAMYLGGVGIDSDDDRPVNNVNKHDVVIRMARHVLVDSRRKQLESVRQGFYQVLPELEPKLALLDGREIALVMTGSGFLDRDEVKRMLVFDPESWAENIQGDNTRLGLTQAQQHLARFIDNVSAPGLRSFLLRTTGRLGISPYQSRNVVVLAHSDRRITLPHFDSSGQILRLPGDSSTYEGVCNRLARALQLAEDDGMRKSAMDRDELAGVTRALQGDVQAGAWYRCPCGYLYGVGNCGGAMEQGRCPQCSAVIGGQNHRIRDDNANDLTVAEGANVLGWNQNARRIVR